MQSDRPARLHLPDRAVMRRHVLGALGSYWPRNADRVAHLPLVEPPVAPPLRLPLRLVAIAVPPWAHAWAVDGQLLVPQECVSDRALASEAPWRSVDWILAAFLLLEGWHERLWEEQNGPLHSYSVLLQGWDQRVWQRAWVNRIALFLRCWASVQGDAAGCADLGDLPGSTIHLTHDVDALSKTLAIRLKQAAFNLFKALRALHRLRVVALVQHSRQALAFLFSRDQWFTFDHLLALEQQAGVQATFHFFAAAQPGNLRRWLLDPGYRIEALCLRSLWHRLHQAGHGVGLHPGFETWRRSDLIAASRRRLEQACGSRVHHCRQHWLRFSWRQTWQAQAAAGLQQDSTLMFNDRPGFRTSAALRWHPWDPATGTTHPILALPTVLMDSHCYDYDPMSDQQRREAIQYWIGECRAVRGQVAVLWHPHTLSRDYNWTEGFRDLLAAIVRESSP